MSKVALITGCSEPTSIGAALALDLQRRGYRVFATARKVSTMDHLGSAGLELLALDVTSAESIAAAVDAVTANAGRLDLLVNNAGIPGTAPLLDVDLSRAREVFEVNAWGQLAVSQAFAPLLVRTATNGERTRILNVGSVASHIMPFMAIYGASKAAAQALSDGLRMELDPLNVDVITLELGSVHTAMSEGRKDFEIASSKPSGLYANFNTVIMPELNKMTDKLSSQAIRPDKLARQIGAVVSQRRAPRKVWLGTVAWLFRWVIPYMPVWLYDWIVKRNQRVDLVPTPTRKSV